MYFTSGVTLKCDKEMGLSLPMLFKILHYDMLPLSEIRALVIKMKQKTQVHVLS